MNRPAYETQEDIDREAKAAAEISARFNCESVKMPKFYSVDYGLVRDKKLVAFAEIKYRTHKFGEYKTLILSLDKWIKMMQLQINTGIYTALFASFTDGIYYVQANKMHPVSVGGRKDRGDSSDVEPVVNIPIDEFWPLDGKK